MFGIASGQKNFPLTLHDRSTGYPNAICVDGTLHIRAAKTASELIDNLNAGAALVEGSVKRDADFHDHLSLCEYIEHVHRLIEAVLPPFHPVAFLFSKCINAYTENAPPPMKMIREALAAFDLLHIGEKQRIFNGWHVPAERPTSSELTEVPDFLIYRILRFQLGGDRPSVHFDYRNDDEVGVNPFACW